MDLVVLNPVRHRIIQLADGLFTEVWLDGKYTRIQAAFPKEQAIYAVRMSRQRFTFKD